jgi:hypothetical protein
MNGYPLEKKITLENLYPGLSQEEYEEIEYNLDQYISFMWRIFRKKHQLDRDAKDSLS